MTTQQPSFFKGAKGWNYGIIVKIQVPLWDFFYGNNLIKKDNKKWNKLLQVNP